MKCPKCGSRDYVKNGNANGNPRKRCKQCGCNFTQSKPRGKPILLKRRALQLYLEGLGFRSIGRLLGVSNVALLNWIRSFGQQTLRTWQLEGKVKVVELDEMHSYIGHKKLLLDRDCC